MTKKNENDKYDDIYKDTLLRIADILYDNNKLTYKEFVRINNRIMQNKEVYI
jgi:hypothetical protein